jgi:predicted lipoprotein with Yx(FWY)xxD motif
MAVMRRLAALLALVAGLTAACASEAPGTDAAPRSSSALNTSPSSAPPTSSSSSSPAPATGTVITTGDSEYGVMLFDDVGQAIYLFDKESDGTPACYDDCAANWPPVLTSGAPQGSGGSQVGLLGTVDRSDGSTQVTYAGHPLYYYAHEDAGEVLCHDVDDYGGTWLVVTPEGSPAP